MKKTSVTLPGFTPRPYPIGRAADLAAHSLSADSLVSVESVEVVNPSISGDSPVSVESIFEKPIGSTTNLLSEEFLSVFERISSFEGFREKLFVGMPDRKVPENCNTYVSGQWALKRHVFLAGTTA